MASKKKTNGTAKRKAKATADASENRAVDAPQITPNKLKRVVADCISILTENGERAGAIGDLKRAAAEQGMDGQALGMLVRLKRKGLTNPHTLGAILRSFDFGREALELDAMVPADFFEEPTAGKKTHRRKKAAAEESDTDQNQTDSETATEETDTNVENLDEHRASAA
jgi:hypothetical protein